MWLLVTGSADVFFFLFVFLLGFVLFFVVNSSPVCPFLLTNDVESTQFDFLNCHPDLDLELTHYSVLNTKMHLRLGAFAKHPSTHPAKAIPWTFSYIWRMENTIHCKLS